MENKPENLFIESILNSEKTVAFSYNRNRSTWLDNEPGPICLCGKKTIIRQAYDGTWMAICPIHVHNGRKHTLIKALPQAPPDGWWTMTREQQEQACDEADEAFRNSKVFKEKYQDAVKLDKKSPSLFARFLRLFGIKTS